MSLKGLRGVVPAEAIGDDQTGGLGGGDPFPAFLKDLRKFLSTWRINQTKTCVRTLFP